MTASRSHAIRPIPQSPDGLRHLANLSTLGAEDIEDELARFSRRCEAGTLLVHDGDQANRIMVVLSGWCFAAKCLEDGEHQIIDFLVPGDILALAGGDGATAGAAVEAVTDATVALVPAHAWSEMLKSHPKLEEVVDRIFAASHARSSERVLRLGKGSAETRIAYALIELSLRLKAVEQSSGLVYHLPLTQRHIGDFTGLSSVHVCRTLRRLERHEIVDVSDHIDVRILDLEALAGIAQADLDLLEREIMPAPL